MHHNRKGSVRSPLLLQFIIHCGKLKANKLFVGEEKHMKQSWNDYVDTFEEEEEVDLAKVKSDIASLEKELQDVQAKMNEYLKELGV